MHPVLHERRYLIPFRATLLPQIFTDVLVIGGGVAGLRAALAAAGQGGEVIVALKGDAHQSNTYWAQGGIAAVMDPDDSLDQHVSDTLDAGGDLCNPIAVRQVVEAGPAAMAELLEWGMPVDRGAGNGPALGREGGHSCRRILHAHGDATGKALAVTLDGLARRHDHIRLFENCFVLDLITDSSANPRCLGAITHHPKYGLQVIWAKATILASGGCGQVYRESTNPAVATGDGLAMAYRAGAQLADMAFVQFHPTTLYVAGAARSLITEAVRGEGAQLIDRNGHRFMPEYHELADLAPRDVVARAILDRMARTAYTHVYLDCRHIPPARFAERFPGFRELLRKFDIDPMVDPVPVHPSAHYMVGGVLTDLDGRTSVPGLYAAGEAACTGLHGANRLASNSLLEGLVFGRAAGLACRELLDEKPAGPAKVISDIRPSDRAELDLPDVRSSLRSVMWRQVGIQREGDRLEEVGDMIEFWARYTLDKIFDDRAGWEVQNLLLAGALITTAAHWRNESRGTHYRLDHPQPEAAFRVHDVWQKHDVAPTRLSVDWYADDAATGPKTYRSRWGV